MRWLVIALVVVGCGSSPRAHAPMRAGPTASRVPSASLAVVSFAQPGQSFLREAHLTDDALWMLTALGLVRVDLRGAEAIETLVAEPPAGMRPLRMQVAGSTVIVSWVGDSERCVEVLDTARGMQRRTLPKDALFDLAASDDGQWLVYRTTTEIVVTDVEHWQHKTLPSTRGDLALSEGARHVAVGATVFDANGRQVWSAKGRPSKPEDDVSHTLLRYTFVKQEPGDQVWSEWALTDPRSGEPQLWAMFGWDYALFTDGKSYQRFGNIDHASAFLRCKDKDGILHPYAACAHESPLF